MKLATSKAEQKRLVNAWKTAGPELERLRRESLAGLPHRAQEVDGLLRLGDAYDGPVREPHGMVEMQRWFMKFARRLGKVPSAVREESARYGSDIPENRRRALCAAMGAEAPAGLWHLGRIAILEKPLTAFFCSARCPGALIRKAYDLAQHWRAANQPIIGGFHSPVEKEVLKIMLRSGTPACVVLARSLPKRITTEFRRPLDEGRLLLLSPFGSAQGGPFGSAQGGPFGSAQGGPFDPRTKRATRETAARRNQVVAALAERVFVAYAAPGSKTEAFGREMAGAGKTCLTFDDPKTGNLKSAGFAGLLL